jgi:hypothetical protein
MKKIFAVLSIAVLISFSSRACSICGCGGGNLYMGLLPDFQYQFVGIRYNYAQYHTQLLNDPSQFSSNYYNSIELWGGVHIGSKFQVLAFIPYYFNKQVDDDGTSTPKGLADITLMGQYLVFHFKSMNRSRKRIDQQLWLGGGIKLPTGSFNADMTDSTTTVADINAQLGTGSTDFLLSGLYALRIGRFGINTAVNYKINTVNKDDYRYGNKLSGTLLGYYRIQMKQNSLAPNLGFGFENVASNALQKKSVQYTGSHVTSAIAGIEFAFNKIAIGINGQIPIVQNFAEGQTKMKFRGMLHMTFAI